MLDEVKRGRPWSAEELDAIVADYFGMLGAEIEGRPYTKAHYRAALAARIGRGDGAIEFKHQNISAVLDELGMPWIRGYVPMRNYQADILGAIDRYLSGHPELPAFVPARRAEGPTEEVFVDRPAARELEQHLPEFERLARKFDPGERDLRNRELGKAGEAFVVELERRRLHECGRAELSRKVRWIAEEEGDGAGFDVLSFDPGGGGERLIEVKTTNGSARTPFYLSENERRVSVARAEYWRLYRVHEFVRSPRIFTLSPPLEESLHLAPLQWRASIKAAARAQAAGR